METTKETPYQRYFKGFVLIIPATTGEVLARILAIYGIFKRLLINKGNKIENLNKWLITLAISKDQNAGVFADELLNDTMIKPRPWKPGELIPEGAPFVVKDNMVQPYRYGNPDETISSGYGKNFVLNTFTKFGGRCRRFLDVLDPNHSIKSIEEDENNNQNGSDS